MSHLRAEGMNQLPEFADFNILNRVGIGGDSEVFELERDGDRLALKIQTIGSEGVPEPRRRLAFKREAAYLACLNHPSLPEVHEIGQHDGRPYLLMEMVAGQTLRERMNSGPLQEKDLIRLGMDIAGALAEVHRHGLTHRDVKPDNIIIQSDGVAKLVDFGFAARVSKHVEQTRDTAGTFRYSAPEQSGMLHLPVDGRSDLYALGVVLYECAAGRPPFVGQNAAEVIRLHAVQAPPPLQELAPELSPALARLIERLLAKDPDDRCQSAAALKADLEHLRRDPRGSTLTEDGPIRGIVRAHAPDLENVQSVRQQEMAALSKFWHQARRGSRLITIVEGQPGAGKSQLIDNFLHAAEQQGAWVLACECQQTDSIPLAPLRHAIERYIEQLAKRPAEEKRRVRSLLAEAARGFLPELGRLSYPLASFMDWEEAAAVPADDVHSEPYYQALSTFLERLSELSPSGLIIAVDDAHWMDAATLEVIRRVAGRDDRASLLILLAVQPGQEEQQDPLGDLPRASRIRLQSLSEAQTEQLVSGWLGGRPVERKLVTRLHRLADGNPRHARQYLQSILDGGALTPSGGIWILDESRLSELNLPSDVQILIEQRFEELDPSVKSFLEIAAVCGRDFSMDLATKAAHIERKEAAAAVSAGLEAGVVEALGGRTYRFVHEELREQLLSHHTQAQRRELHQLIAELLYEKGVEGPEDVFTVARHYGQGTMQASPKRVYEVSYIAGQLAMRDHAYRQAYEHLKLAVRAHEAADLGPGLSLQEALGEVCTILGYYDEASDHLRFALEHAADPLARAQLHAKLGWMLVTEFENDEALRHARQGLRELGQPLPSSSLQYSLMTVYHFVRYLLADRLGWGFGKESGKQRRYYEVADQLQQIAAHVWYFSAEHLRMLHLIARSLDYSHRGAGERQLAMGYANYATVLALFGWKEGAKKFIGRAIALAEKAGDRLALAHAANYEGYALNFAGDPIAAERAARKCLTEYGPWLENWDYGGAIVNLAWSLVLRGQVQAALYWHELLQQRIHSPNSSPDDERSFGQLLFAPILAIVGRPVEAGEYLKPPGNLSSVLTEDVIRRAFHAADKLFYQFEQGEIGEEFDQAVELYRSMDLDPKMVPLHVKHFYVVEGYGRLLKIWKADQDPDRDQLGGLERAVEDLSRAGDHPLLRAHRLTIQGGLQALVGDPDKALKLLAEAEGVAAEYGNLWAIFEVQVQRAFVMRQRGQSDSCRSLAYAAHALAVANGWVSRARRVVEVFGVGEESSGKLSGGHSSTIDSEGERRVKRYLDALLQVSQATAKQRQPEQHARAALREVMKILAAERGFLFLSEDGNSLGFNVGSDSEGHELRELEGYSRTVVNKVWMNGEPLLVSGDDQAEALGAESARTHGLRSIAAVPVRGAGRTQGVLYLDSKVAKGVFSADDLDVLQAVANHIGVGLEGARATEVEVKLKVEQRNRRVAESLRQVSSALSSTLELSQVLELLLEGIKSAVAYDMGAVILRREDGYQLMAVGGAPIRGELPFPLTDSAVLRLIKEVERNREPAIVGGALAPDWLELQSRAAEGFSRVLVPIYSRQALSGVLLLDAEGAGAFDEPSIELLASIADQAGIAIENAHLFGEVQRLATEDGLTGLPNRRHFMEVAKQEFERARRFDHPLSVIMLDIDHFKQVNDQFGHNAGDEILKLVANRCQANVRTVDSLGRVGGEEFAVILPETPRNGAARLAQRLRQSIAELTYQANSSAVQVTASFGVAEQGADDRDFAALLGRADQALYHAKNHGRNRVSLADERTVRQAGSGKDS